MKRIFVGITGASGSIYGLRLVEALLDAGCSVHLCASSWGQAVMNEETGRPWASWTESFATQGPGTCQIWPIQNLGAGPASGSFALDATVICPCSVSTLGHVASGAAINLIHRAASVALKEGRPLVLVPRETPLSLIDLRNLTILAESGAAILPAMPGFYHRPQSIDELVNHMVGKILLRLGLDQNLFPTWTGMNNS